MSFEEHKLNNIKVKPVVEVIEGGSEGSIKGHQLFNLKNWICYISARKKSGKTSLISNIIDKTTSKKTTIWLFCSTYKIDKTWIEVVKGLKAKGYIVNCFESIVDGSGKKSVNNLEIVLDDLAKGDEDENKAIKKEDEPEEFVDRFGIMRKKGLGSIFKAKASPKKKKPKIQVASNLFIIDDLPQQLKNPAVDRLCKTHRHSNSNVILSSQYCKDLNPCSITQIDYLICFKGYNDEKMEHLHKILDLSIPFPLFHSIYNHCCSEDFHFMNLNVRTEDIRKNFNTAITYDLPTKEF
jgi:hypothetical protein